MSAKQLELLKQAVPGVTRVAMLGGPSWPAMPALEDVTRSLALELSFFAVSDPTTFDSTFAAMTRSQAQALLDMGDPLHFPYRQRIAALAVQHRLPAIGPGRGRAEAGYLMSYGPSDRDRGQRIAAYVDKILHGARPADLPVEEPMRFEFVINLKTAQALGITFPPTLLVLADEVLQ